MQTEDYSQAPSAEQPKTRAERIALAAAASAKGESHQTIARRLGVAKATVKGYLKEHARVVARQRWDQDQILDRIRDWHALYGRAPSRGEWDAGWQSIEPTVSKHRQEWPSTVAIEAHFRGDIERDGEWRRYLWPLDVAVRNAGLDPYQPSISVCGATTLAFILEAPIGSEALEELREYASHLLAAYDAEAEVRRVTGDLADGGHAAHVIEVDLFLEDHVAFRVLAARLCEIVRMLERKWDKVAMPPDLASEPTEP